MLRLPLEDRLQDQGAFELIGIGLVARRGSYVERDRVSDLRLFVIGIARSKRLLRLKEGLNARAMVDLVVIGIERQEGVDVVALALRLGTDGLSLLQGSEAER